MPLHRTENSLTNGVSLLQVFFLNGSKGRLFGVYHPPDPNIGDRGDFIFIPPFGEELNRSRHMITAMSRALNRAGYGVLVFDLYGTGDSEGRFCDAGWEIWKSDILTAHQWLTDQGRNNISFWAMRTGALLATDLVCENPDLVKNILFWAAVTSGKTFTTQLLRIKLAAYMASGQDNVPQSTKEMVAQLEKGTPIEIGGYDFMPDMAQRLSALQLEKMSLPAGLDIDWLDVGLVAEPKLSAGANKVIRQWEENGTTVRAKIIQDVAFWSLQGPEWAEKLIEQTLNSLCEAT